jgi:hypothetical protein
LNWKYPIHWNLLLRFIWIKLETLLFVIKFNIFSPIFIFHTYYFLYKKANFYSTAEQICKTISDNFFSGGNFLWLILAHLILVWDFFPFSWFGFFTYCNIDVQSEKWKEFSTYWEIIEKVHFPYYNYFNL